MREIWKTIKGCENYEISNMGNVRSKPREGTKGGIIKCFSDGRYLKIHIYLNGKQKQLYIHRLVAEHFIPNELDKPQINHIDGDKTNNKVDNLEWTTCRENLQHAIDIGLRELKRVDQFKNGILIKEYTNALQASKATGLCYSSIWCALNGKTKTAGGFEWKYM